MPSRPLLKFSGVLLAQAKSLLSGPEKTATPAETIIRPASPWPEVSGGLGATRQDKSFWASVTAADGRLAELRRAIDQAAAEAIAREAAEASSSSDPQLKESRCETAARVITEALGTEKS